MRSAFIADINTVLSDITRIHRATQVGTPKALRTICSGLADDRRHGLRDPAGAVHQADDGYQRAGAGHVRRRQLLLQASSVHSARVEQVLSQLDSGESELKRCSRCWRRPASIGGPVCDRFVVMAAVRAA